MELLLSRLIDIGYTPEQALELIDIYDQAKKLPKLEDYISTKESLRGEL